MRGLGGILIWRREVGAWGGGAVVCFRWLAGECGNGGGKVFSGAMWRELIDVEEA